MRKIKPLIYIFCEGESEVEYAKCLKEKYSDVAVIKKPVKGLFSEAESKFNKEIRYRNNVEVTDEIWFFFDVDHGQAGSWKNNYKIIETLRKLKKQPHIRVRLLMTSGCVEYWYLLHYEKIRPPVQSIAEKNKVMMLLKKHNPGYFKGDSITISEIAQRMDVAVENGRWSLKNIEELLKLKDEDIRNQWLYHTEETFTTVQEAIEFLENIRK